MLLVGALLEGMERIALGDYVTGTPAFRTAWWVEPYLYSHPILFGIVFAAGFLFVARHFTGTVDTQFGVRFGLVLFLIGSFPIFVLFGVALAVPTEALPFWVLRNLSQYVSAGAALGWLIGRQQRNKYSESVLVVTMYPHNHLDQYEDRQLRQGR